MTKRGYVFSDVLHSLKIFVPFSSLAYLQFHMFIAIVFSISLVFHAFTFYGALKNEYLALTLHLPGISCFWHTMVILGSCLEKVTTMPAARKTTHGLDGQHQYVDRTPRGRVRMTVDRVKWRKYVHGVANPQIEDG